MIITKTPYRISFFGGGSDYPKWYRKFGGSVLSTTIDKHIYISCRYLPGFFKHKYRIVWSKIENVTDINEIEHHAIKNLLKYLKFKKGLEIHYDGDLPARSGMGSSSSFIVGLMKAIITINKKKISQQNLGKKAIFFEQNVLNEVVGSQDQIAASVGGLNKIKFNKNGSIKVKKIKQNNNLKKLEKNLLLIYTSINRTAHEIASSYVNNLTKSKKKYIESILTNVNEGEKILKTGNIDDFGELLHSSWMFKKKLSSAVSNSKIDDLYNHALISGASGGKLLGAGGGGFLLLYMKKKYRKKFFLESKKLINIPFKFSNIGSEVIYNNFQS
jgi:D-glycero-alpha-D-manno-heptose-7-phosphate kinase